MTERTEQPDAAPVGGPTAPPLEQFRDPATGQPLFRQTREQQPPPLATVTPARTLKYPPAAHGCCAHGYITGCSACEAAGVTRVDPDLHCLAAALRDVLHKAGAPVPAWDGVLTDEALLAAAEKFCRQQPAPVAAGGAGQVADRLKVIEDKLDRAIIYVGKLTSALKWYADAGNYSKQGGMPANMEYDAGQLARAALAAPAGGAAGEG